MTAINRPIVWSNFDLNFVSTVDQTNPVIPAAIDLPIGNPTFEITAAAPSGVLVGNMSVISDRDFRLNRVIIGLTTEASVTGPAAAATVDLTLAFKRVPPPYTAVTTVESVGPTAVPVGSGFVSTDFDFSLAATAGKGNAMSLTLSGLSSVVLPGTPPVSTSMVRVFGSVEWEIIGRT